MGEYLNMRNQQYQYLLMDFIEQGKRFERGTGMTDEDREFLALWRQNEEKIKNLQARTNALWGQMKKAQQYQDEVRCRLQEEMLLPFFKLWIFSKNVSVFDLADGYTIDGTRLYLDVNLEPVGIKQNFASRNKGPVAKIVRSLFESLPEFKLGEHHDRPGLETTFCPFADDEWRKSIDSTMAILARMAERIDKPKL